MMKIMIQQLLVINTIAVSYTHLRFTFPKDAQHKNVIFYSINGSDDGSIIEYDMETNSFKARTNHTSYGLKDMYIYGTFDKPMTYTRTVSYTHLDVYKRQKLAS